MQKKKSFLPQTRSSSWLERGIFAQSVGEEEGTKIPPFYSFSRKTLLH